VSSGRTMVNGEFVGMWKEAVVAYFIAVTEFFLV
jgi:hypothetical protein